MEVLEDVKLVEGIPKILIRQFLLRVSQITRDVKLLLLTYFMLHVHPAFSRCINRPGTELCVAFVSPDPGIKGRVEAMFSIHKYIFKKNIYISLKGAVI